MATSKFIQTALNAGEEAERMAGRVDFKKYFNGLSKMVNAIPLKQGGAEKRPGLEYVAEAKGLAKLLPFEFSVEDTVVIEAGDEYMRFFTEAGQVEVDDPIGDTDFVHLGTYIWTESTNGFDEYYCTLPDRSDPGIVEPDSLYEQFIRLGNGVLGSLERGEWAFGDNDSLGFNTIYTRLTLRA
jgi:hypothetical protein